MVSLCLFLFPAQSCHGLSIYCSRVHILCICAISVPFSLGDGSCLLLGSTFFRTLSADMENVCGEEPHILCLGGPLRKA